MKYSLTKFIIGFIYEILIWNKRTFADNNSVCDIGPNTEGFLIANCSSRQLVDVPQDLNSSIEFLFLMNNTFVRLDEKSFTKYPNLILLSLQNTAYIDQSDPINYYTFRPLKKLEILLFNEIITPFNFSFHWPPSLRQISVNHNKYITDIDLSNLRKLQRLHALTSTLREFPKFHVLSPLSYLDFRGNPMDGLSAEDLAPYCTLDSLSLEWPEDAVINSSDRYCQCQRLENWINQFHIDNNASLNCTPSLNLDAEPCEMEYSEDTLSKRRDCLNRIVKSSVSIWFWMISCILMFGPLIIVTFRETKAHQKWSLKSTTTTKKPGRFPNVELMIDVDEDFVDEDEQEFDFFDANIHNRNISKIDRTSLHVKPQPKCENLDFYESSDSSSDEMEESEEEEEYEYEEFVKKDGKFEIETFKSDQKRETQTKKLRSNSKNFFKNIERKPSLQVKPQEDFEDVFDVEMPKTKEQEEYEKFYKRNKRKTSYQVGMHSDLKNEFVIKSPENRAEVKTVNGNFSVEEIGNKNKFSSFLKCGEEFGEPCVSEALKENNECRSPKPSPESSRKNELEMLVIKSCKDNCSVSDACKMISSLEVFEKKNSPKNETCESNIKNLLPRESEQVFNHQSPAVLVKDCPEMFSLEIRKENPEVYECQSHTIAQSQEKIPNEERTHESEKRTPIVQEEKF